MDKPGGSPLALKLSVVPSGSLADRANEVFEFKRLL